MKYIILILLTFIFSIQIHGQTKTVSSEILSHTETSKLFSESVNEAIEHHLSYLQSLQMLGQNRAILYCL